MDRQLHQLRVKLTGYNTHKDEALYTALNNTATLSQKSAQIITHLQNEIHQRGMRVARLLSRIQGLEQKLGHISNTTQGLQIVAPLDYPEVPFSSSENSQPQTPELYNADSASEEQQKIHQKRVDELKSSKYNYISSFLPSYSQNNDYAIAFDALSKSLTNISCKIKSNDSDLKYLSNRLKLTDQSICDINQLIQQRLVKRNPFTDHRKFILDSQRATHVVKLTKQGIGKKPKNVQNFADVHLFGSMMNIYDASSKDTAQLQKLLENQKRKQIKNRARVQHLEELLIPKDGLKGLGGKRANRHVFKPTQNENQPKIKVDEFLQNSKTAKNLIQIMQRAGSTSVQDDYDDDILPTYDESNLDEEESDDEEEKEKRLAQEEYFKEDMLGYVKFKKQQKKEEMSNQQITNRNSDNQEYVTNTSLVQSQQNLSQSVIPYNGGQSVEQNANSPIGGGEQTSAIPPIGNSSASCVTPSIQSSQSPSRPPPPKSAYNDEISRTSTAPISRPKSQIGQKISQPQPLKPNLSKSQTSAIPQIVAKSAIPQIGGSSLPPPPPPPPPPSAPALQTSQTIAGKSLTIQQELQLKSKQQKHSQPNRANMTSARPSQPAQKKINQPKQIPAQKHKNQVDSNLLSQSTPVPLPSALKPALASTQAAPPPPPPSPPPPLPASVSIPKEEQRKIPSRVPSMTGSIAASQQQEKQEKLELSLAQQVKNARSALKPTASNTMNNILNIKEKLKQQQKKKEEEQNKKNYGRRVTAIQMLKGVINMRLQGREDDVEQDDEENQSEDSGSDYD